MGPGQGLDEGFNEGLHKGTAQTPQTFGFQLSGPSSGTSGRRMVAKIKSKTYGHPPFAIKNGMRDSPAKTFYGAMKNRANFKLMTNERCCWHRGLPFKYMSIKEPKERRHMELRWSRRTHSTKVCTTRQGSLAFTQLMALDDVTEAA